MTNLPAKTPVFFGSSTGLELVPDAVLEFDGDGVVVAANDSAARMFLCTTRGAARPACGPAVRRPGATACAAGPRRAGGSPADQGAGASRERRAVSARAEPARRDARTADVRVVRAARARLRRSGARGQPVLRHRVRSGADRHGHLQRRRRVRPRQPRAVRVARTRRRPAARAPGPGVHPPRRPPARCRCRLGHPGRETQHLSAPEALRPARRRGRLGDRQSDVPARRTRPSAQLGGAVQDITALRHTPAPE